MTTRPNILILMADQLTGTLFPDGPAEFLHVPALRRLAERSTRFARAYCPSPLCAPSRASVMSGQMPFRTGVYDNAAEFSSAIPTYAHHLRSAGYRTILSGKMHFVGPDQLHGFEERLTTDVYPADFGWTPDWRRPNERIDWWYHNMGSVTGAGVAEITNQLEYDDEVAFQAQAKLYDLARGHDPRPWCLTVSFTHPHDPFVARRRYWDLYADGPLDPETPPPEAYDPHSRRLLHACNRDAFDITDEDVRRSRRAYFANVSYVDDKFGEILAVLEATRQEAVIVVLSDHGEMLGEAGMWFKMSFREGSARVPLMIAAPEMPPGRVDVPVSTVDLVPTLAEIGGADPEAVAPWTDGTSLVAVAGGAGRAPVGVEYAAEGSVAPMICLVEGTQDGGTWKYTACPVDPEELFDLAADPHERQNLATDPAQAERMARFRALASERWDLGRIDTQVRESQAARWVVYPALRAGSFEPWDYQPYRAASERYMRNHLDLNVLEENQRYPRGE